MTHFFLVKNYKKPTNKGFISCTFIRKFSVKTTKCNNDELKQYVQSKVFLSKIL